MPASKLTVLVQKLLSCCSYGSTVCQKVEDGLTTQWRHEVIMKEKLISAKAGPLAIYPIHCTAKQEEAVFGSREECSAIGR